MCYRYLSQALSPLLEVLYQEHRNLRRRVCKGDIGPWIDHDAAVCVKNHLGSVMTIAAVSRVAYIATVRQRIMQRRSPE